MSGKNNMRSENFRLKQQLAIARDELQTIKGSRTFGTIRMASHAKSQFKQSPLKFIKKSIEKIAKGTLKSKNEALRKNLHSRDDLQSQYSDWILLNEPDATELEYQKIQSDNFAKKPLISIITPVFNPPVDVFVELVESVLAQTYPNFELCLGNFGDSEEIKKTIDAYAQKDSRVKSLAFSENKGIAENSNKILATVKGDYIALLDHDDTLSSNALFENVKLINEEDYDFIYSDKDKIDSEGNRFEPFFKPGWSPEVMLSANYLTHLNVMKTSLVRKIGAWDSNTDGAQDWDLFLKVVAESKKIGHIQKVLYHWRVIATSTALSIETKPYALAGQRNAVDAYMKKMKIPAQSYHEGAELLLKWRASSSRTICLVKSHSNTHLRPFLMSLDQNSSISKKVQFIILHDYKLDETTRSSNRVQYVEYVKGAYGAMLESLLNKFSKNNILFFDDRLNFDLTDETVQKLAGWLEIKGVVASGPRIVDRKGFSIDCGASITSNGIVPLFSGVPPYHQAPIGNIEWVRNMVMVSPYVFVANASNLLKAYGEVKKRDVGDSQIHPALQLQLSRRGRLVLNPKVIINELKHSHIDIHEMYDSSDELLDIFETTDPYVNKNIAADNPMKLVEITQSDDVDEPPAIEYSYQVEASAHASARTLSLEVIKKNREFLDREHTKQVAAIGSMVIFLPDFQGIYAGLNNIFSFASQYHHRGVRVTFALMTADKTFDRQHKLITEKFPELHSSTIVAISNETVSQLPHFDISVCTQWATAYILAQFNKTHRKCYFIQDKESSFYPKGTISALVDNSYELGFLGLANTPGLLEWYEKEFNGKGVVIKSRIDLSKHHAPDKLNISPETPYKVFFYARPNEPRNAFELGVAAARQLKRSLGDKIEIYAAGADWSPEEYGIEDVLVNLGKIEYDKVPAFYRSMDAGLMFMFSGHPGVVASELMASGCPVIVNEYHDSTWYDLYQHEKTCLVSIPTADEVARNVRRSLEDTRLRKVIIEGGLNKVKDFYSSYEASVEASYQYLLERVV